MELEPYLNFNAPWKKPLTQEEIDDATWAKGVIFEHLEKGEKCNPQTPDGKLLLNE